MRTRVYFRNTFHNTGCWLDFKDGDLILSANQEKKLERKLCGHRGCQCGVWHQPKTELVPVTIEDEQCGTLGHRVIADTIPRGDMWVPGRER